MARLVFLTGNISSGLAAAGDLSRYLQRGWDDTGAIHKMRPSLSSPACLGPCSTNTRGPGNNPESDGGTNSNERFDQGLTVCQAPS